jgi:hypothetical protein
MSGSNASSSLSSSDPNAGYVHLIYLIGGGISYVVVLLPDWLPITDILVVYVSQGVDIFIRACIVN